MITDKREVLKVARERALRMPLEQRFTALDLLGSDIPRPFWSDIQGAIRRWDEEISFHYRNDEHEALVIGKHVDSEVGRVLSFLWIGEEE